MSSNQNIHVKKRSGKLESLNIDKINLCAERACYGLENVSSSEVVIDANVQFYDKIPTKEIDKALVYSARQKVEKEPNYSYVASRLLLGSITKEVFGSSTDKDSYDSEYRVCYIKNLRKLSKNEILNPKLLEFDLKRLSQSLVPERDKKFKYLGLQTIYDRYLLHIEGRRLETPQAFWMRVAMGLSLNEEHKDERAIEFYHVLSEFRLCCSTPTLFNSGSTHSQLSSCYLNTFDDSIDGIFEGLWQEARKSKYAGGLGFDVTPWRASNSFVKGTNGKSSGLVPWLKIYNDTLIAVDQGGKRPGAGCAYLEPWHLDIEEFLDLKKNTGDERRRCHDMNTANWIPDLFFRKIKQNGKWYLFSPSDTRDLHELYGEEFDKRYKHYCKLADKGEIPNYKVIDAKDLWKKMLKVLFETGHPWVTFKDNANIRYSNSHKGVVHSSNLCTEIFLHTKPSLYDEGKKIEVGETAVCNLSSVNLKEHLRDGKIDYELLAGTISLQIRMLDNVIDLNFYPTAEAEKANMAHRPIGAGSMGWADVFHSYGVDFSSEDAVKFSDELYEFISYHCILNSSRLAQERGRYESYEGSSWDQGIFPIDTYKKLIEYLGEKPIIHRGKKYVPELDWKTVRESVRDNGIRNSNTMAIAPTATISFIVGCSPCIEPDFSVLYVYENKSGNIYVINEWFVEACKKINLWDQSVIEAVKLVDGDLSLLNGTLPEEIKNQFRTAFSQDQFKLIDCAAARQKWIDMGQSLNLFNDQSSMKYLNDLYFHARNRGLKSTYYLRGRAASKIEKSDAGTQDHNQKTEESDEALACSIQATASGETCDVCQ